ncbi:hypothetical protein ACOSQ2_007544 [Xanthoceras sorbifolium]
MAPQPQKEDLLEIGFEGFAMADDIYGRRTRLSQLPPLTPTPPQPRYHHHLCLDSIQAAQFYGGTVIVDYS